MRRNGARRRPGQILAVLGVAAMAVSAGCGGGGSSRTTDGSPAHRAGSTTLNIGLPEDPGTLDPHLFPATAGMHVSRYLYDYLVSLSPDGEVVPQLATKWRVTPTQITLKIRDDVTCSDGSRMTPSVVKANLDRVKDPATKAPWTDYWLGSSKYQVTADDAAGTVRIRLSKPYTPLLASLSQYPAMVCKAGLRNPKRLQGESIGSGPFVLKQKVTDDHYTLVRRDGYAWGPDGAATSVDGFPEMVTLHVVTNETTAANQLENGELDIAPIAGPERKRLEGNGNLRATVVPVRTTTLHFNQAKGRPTADPEIRRALVQAIDRQALTLAGYGEFGKVATTIMPKGSKCYSDEPGRVIAPYDPDAAKQVLSAAAPSLKLFMIGSQGGEYISEVWNQSGAKTDLSSEDATGPGLEAVFGGGDWDAVVLPWNGVTSLGPMLSRLSGPAPPDGNNFSSVNNPVFVEQVNKAISEFGEASCSAMTKAQSALYGASDVVPLTALGVAYFAQDGVGLAVQGAANAPIIPTSLRTSG